MASDEGTSAEIENIDPLNALDGLQAQDRQTQAGVCRWKDCKKIDKRDEGVVLQECCRDKCKRVVHAACAFRMLKVFGAASTFTAAACSKRCYNALVKKASVPPATAKKRVLWHNDGPTPDVSSISVLLDWLTTGNNYSRYRGGDSHSGESKATLASEIARKIVDARITTTRSVKDITNKIGSLETTFRSAEDWRKTSGQGCDGTEPSIRSALLQRCSYYFELRAIMSSRDSTHPLLLNTDAAARSSDTEVEEDSSSDEESKNGEETAERRTHACRPSSTPISIALQPRKRQRKDDTSSITPFVALKEAQLAQTKELQLLELESRKKQTELQEQELSVRRQQIDNESRAVEARISESNAHASKFREEAEHWRLQRKVVLLRERQKLQDEGVSQSDIELLLPLTAYF